MSLNLVVHDSDIRKSLPLPSRTLYRAHLCTLLFPFSFTYAFQLHHSAGGYIPFRIHFILSQLIPSVKLLCALTFHLRLNFAPDKVPAASFLSPGPISPWALPRAFLFSRIPFKINLWLRFCKAIGLADAPSTSSRITARRLPRSRTSLNAPKPRRSRQEVGEANILLSTRPRVPAKRFVEDDDSTPAPKNVKGKQSTYYVILLRSVLCVIG
jgi:hypothetical protein